jgi:hypothetical protein
MPACDPDAYTARLNDVVVVHMDPIAIVVTHHDA